MSVVFKSVRTLFQLFQLFQFNLPEVALRVPDPWWQARSVAVVSGQVQGQTIDGLHSLRLTLLMMVTIVVVVER
jgi:hypothetical protein